MLPFFELLSVCHTVQIDPEKNATEKFQASSPDEFSFVKFLEKIGIIYKGDERQTVGPNQKIIRSVNFLNKIRFYEVLHILEFDSNRKRMSVIVKCLQTNNYLVFCKGIYFKFSQGLG